MDAVAVTPNPSIDPARELEEAKKGLIAFLGINQGKVPAKTADFWLLVGTNLGLNLGNRAPAEMVRVILDKVGEEWDDAYLEDGEPTLEGYVSLLRRLEEIQASPDAVSEEDEEDDDAVSVRQDDVFITQTDTWPIRSIMDMIDEKTIDLNPGWQRKFVWKLKKQRRFIESILLGLPIPSILLYKEKDGRITVIDGRQRLETLHNFMRPPNPKKPLRTFPASMVGWRPGEKLNDAASKSYVKLEKNFQTDFQTKNVPVHMFVGLPRDKLYQIFRRYNEGAEKLKPAEIRNAVYQASPLHKMMYRVAGERADKAAVTDTREKEGIANLWLYLGKKTDRYGAYDFIGRYFAFAHMQNGSVANATNDFMEKYGEADAAQLETFRTEWLDVLEATIEWYDQPLQVPEQGGKFHAFLATIQLVSTNAMLQAIKAGRTTQEKVVEHIQANWVNFAVTVKEDKQNSTNFWKHQETWVRQLTAAVCSE